MKNICEECAFQCICKHECKEKNLHDNYVSRDKIKEIFSNKRNEIIFIKNRNERLYKVKILDEIEKKLLED